MNRMRAMRRKTESSFADAPGLCGRITQTSIVASLLFIVACGIRQPTSADATRALQRALDDASPGVWRVDGFEKTDGREARAHGSPAYVMEGVAHVSRLADTPGMSAVDILAIGIWVGDISGKAGGASRTRPLTLTFLKTENGWRLASVHCKGC